MAVAAGGSAVTVAAVFAVATDGVTVTEGGLTISTATGGVAGAATEGGFVVATSREGGEIFTACGRLVICMAAGGFMATVTLGAVDVSLTENALNTIAFAKTKGFQRFGDIEKAPAFRQELDVRAV